MSYPLPIQVLYSLVFVFAGSVLALAPRDALPADTSLDSGRNCTPEEVDSLLTWFGPLPASGDVEIFSSFDRPRKPRAEIERDFRAFIEEERTRGEVRTDADWERYFQINVESQVDSYSKPVLKRERFRTKGTARRCDYASNMDGPPITPQSAFETTSIQPGSRSDGDKRYYLYEHWHANEITREYYQKYGPGSAYTTEYHNTDDVRDIWEELVGVDRMLLEILAVELCELPKPPLTKVPEARELPLDPKKIEALLADKGSIRLRVSELDVEGEKRLRIRLLSPKGWGILATKELTPFAEIVVKADDFRAVYEQRLFDTKGAETVVVTADGFDDQGIPKEKTWVRRRPDGQHETTSYAILNAKVNIDIPAAEFEFNPPEGYLVDVMGPDGRPIKSDAPPPPAIERKPFTNRLWGLNLLAVLVLAAFTIRKFLLRRQTAAGG